ncbi:hypothetical protein HDU85_004901 [Gaertneriomyces sp. JEL0708]|nr:hypothetical protein HDU85_004901 [Gaertneriomyces sp. JEL0708]
MIEIRVPREWSCPLLEVKSYNADTGVLELSFLSNHDKLLSYQRFADTWNTLGCAPGALKYGEIAGAKDAVPYLGVLKKALEYSASQDPSDVATKGSQAWGEAESTRQTKENQASGVAKSIEEKEKEYENCIKQMKRWLRDPSGTLLDHFESAVSLRPNQFEPYQLLLTIILHYSQEHLNAVDALVKKAYRISPLRTFNLFAAHAVTAHIGANLPDLDKVQHGITLFLQHFPNDFSVYSLAKDINERYQKTLISDAQECETEKQQAYCAHIADALGAVCRRDFSSARNHFTAASYYCIWDTRPYLYKALMDLQRGDLNSTLKLVLEVGHVVNWRHEDDVLAYLLYRGGLITGNESPYKAEIPEKGILSKLFAVCRQSNGNTTAQAKSDFFAAIKTYLQARSDIDVLWTRLALEIGLEKFGGMLYLLNHDKATHDQVINIYSYLLTITYSTIEGNGGDISPYQQFFSERNAMVIDILSTMSWPATQWSKIIIDSDVLGMLRPDALRLLDEFFTDTYVHLCSMLVCNAGVLDAKLASVLQPMPLDGCQLHPNFLAVLVERLNTEGSNKNRVLFLEWAVEHRRIYPNDAARALTASVCRWQLDQPIPCTDQALNDAAKEWMEASGADCGSDGGAFAPCQGLTVAVQTWNRIHEGERVDKDEREDKGKWEKAESRIGSLFNEETALPGEIDVIAFQSLCSARGLCLDVKSLPSDKRVGNAHDALIRCALSIIARKALPGPFALPNRACSEQTLTVLVDLYVGQRQKETDEEYAKRLKKCMPPDWEATAIAGEKPKYTNEKNFIRWVRSYKDVVSDFKRDEDRVRAKFQEEFRDFGHFDKVFAELTSKVKHELAFQKLREMKAACKEGKKTGGERFWQLVEETAKFIECIHTKRNEGRPDMLVMNEDEARFVMQLLYEWGLEAWGERDPKTYAEAFHGPEIHIWGAGPRIWHFNAGIYLAGREKPENVHIYFTPTPKN